MKTLITTWEEQKSFWRESFNWLNNSHKLDFSLLLTKVEKMAEDIISSEINFYVLSHLL